MNIKDYELHVRTQVETIPNRVLVEEYNKIIQQRIAGLLSVAIQGKLPIHMNRDPLGRTFYETSIFLLTEGELEDILEQYVTKGIEKALAPR